MGGENILEIKGLCKAYKDVKALDGLSLSIPKGRVLGFIGQNGAGKTTTLRLLTGLSKPDSGQITVCGQKVVFGSLSTNKYIGFLPDVPEFYGYMRPMEYLTLCGRLYGMAPGDIAAESKRLLSLVGLEGANRKIKGFSRGMKQRLGIAQALIHRPQLLLLDEPTSALDPIGRREVLNIIASLKGEVTVMFSTHILSDAQSVCDDICVMHKGKAVLTGSVEDIRTRFGTQNISIRILQQERLEELALRLQALPGVTKSAVAKEELLLTCTYPYEIFKGLCPLLAEMGIYLKGLELQQASLEEVFMEVTGK